MHGPGGGVYDKPIPSSIIAEGASFWNGASDRGDMAMIAYGAARFALAYGDRATAEELWPLIAWCLECCHRHVTATGVVASDSDELEGRFPAGKANLSTSSLYFDALSSVVLLGRELGKPFDQSGLPEDLCQRGLDEAAAGSVATPPARGLYTRLTMTLGPLLSDAQQQVLVAERALLNELRTSLAQAGADNEAVAELGQSIAQLDELFLLVVVGEFNSGKSAFINALLGRQMLPEGVTPTTAEINVLTYGPAETSEATPGRTRLITAPIDLLRDIHIVDTPGTNAVIREHEVLTTHFVPRADVVLFVTSVDRPFSESERLFLESIRTWGKKVVVVINKQDLLEKAEDLEKVRRFVATNSEKVLGAPPAIFPVSARAAMRAKQGHPELWAASGFEPLEWFIQDTLDQAGRLRLKLLNPIGVARHLLEAQRKTVAERLDLLATDFATLDDVERQLTQYERDLARDVAPRMASIDNVLLEMDRRGQAYFDDTMRIGRIVDLLNKTRMQESFERDVVSDAPAVIERRVDELIDWLVGADLRQWQAVTSHLATQRAAYRDRMVGGDGDHFRADRTRLIQSVGSEAQRVVETYDKRAEARALAEGARNAVAAAAATGVGAVGLGAVVTMAATTAAADITGLVMASVVGAIGFFIIPNRRRRAKLEMRDKVAVMRTRLSTAIRTQFESETARSVQRIRDGIAPYSRFVRAEGEKLTAAKAELERYRGELEALQARVEGMS